MSTVSTNQVVQNRDDRGSSHGLPRAVKGALTTSVHTVVFPPELRATLAAWVASLPPASTSPSGEKILTDVNSSQFHAFGSVWFLHISHQDTTQYRLFLYRTTPDQVNSDPIKSFQEGETANFSVFSGPSRRILIPLSEFRVGISKRVQNWGASNFSLERLRAELDAAGTATMHVVIQRVQPFAPTSHSDSNDSETGQSVGAFETGRTLSALLAQLVNTDTLDVIIRTSAPRNSVHSSDAKAPPLEDVGSAATAEIRANRFVLGMKSPVMQRMFFGPKSVGFQERKTGVVDLSGKYMAHVVRALVHFCYGSTGWRQHIRCADDAFSLFELAMGWEMIDLGNAAAALLEDFLKEKSGSPEFEMPLAIRAVTAGKLLMEAQGRDPVPKSSPSTKWAVGATCMAPWHDGVLYPAEIMTINKSPPTVRVRFVEDKREREVPITKLSSVAMSKSATQEAPTYEVLTAAAAAEQQTGVQTISAADVAERLFNGCKEILAANVDQLLFNHK